MTVTLEEAQAHLADLIAKAAPGEEIVITQDEKQVARLIPEKRAPSKKPRVAGSAKGQLIILQEDDEHLKDFAEYME
jgi:prevent-host-death family protein